MDMKTKNRWIGWGFGLATGIVATLAIPQLIAGKKAHKETYNNVKPLIMVQGHLDTNTMPDILTYDSKGRRAIYLGFEKDGLNYAIDLDIVRKQTLESKAMTESELSETMEKIKGNADSLEKSLFEAINLKLKPKEE